MCMIIGFVLIVFMNGQRYYVVLSILSQLAYTCSKSTIETLEKGVKYVQI